MNEPAYLHQNTWVLAHNPGCSMPVTSSSHDDQRQHVIALERSLHGLGRANVDQCFCGGWRMYAFALYMSVDLVVLVYCGETRIGFRCLIQ